MIVLDASFLIAAENHAEVNHDFASKFMVENRMFLAMHWFTISEYLVYPASGGFADVEYDGLINNVRIHELDRPGEPDLPWPVRLANIRARTGLKMPDAIVLATAQAIGGQVGSFDTALRKAAQAEGVQVVPERLVSG